MSDNKPRFLDVWIVETNTVYKEVPYAVVSDWVQQGRLLEDDMVKPSGTRDWMRLGDSPGLQPFLPKAEPHRPTDQAEALEPVVLDFSYKKRADEEEDDPDMIPLIDVSLVLLVFFMLTATAATMAATVPTPQTEYGDMADDPKALRIDVTRDQEGSPVYALGVGDGPPGPEVHTQAAVLEQLRDRLNRTQGQVDLVINADKDLPARVARDLLLALRAERFRGKISKHYFGVTGVEP
jgi:biopolymer transport protein ExbD